MTSFVFLLVFLLSIEALWISAILKSIDKAKRKNKPHGYFELVVVIGMIIITCVTLVLQFI